MSHYVVIKKIITDQSFHAGGGGPKTLVENQTSALFFLEGFPKYFLPSKRFLLTVHTLTQTQSFKLWTYSQTKPSKGAIRMPRSATNVVIHMQQSLAIKSISQLYTEAHTVSHVRTRLQGDSVVNNAIECTLEREGSWTNKKSTVVQCEAVYMNAKHVNTVQGVTTAFTGESAANLQRQFNNTVKNTATKHMETAHDNTCVEKVKSLAVQGKTLALAAAEKTDFTWKRILFDLKSRHWSDPRPV